MPTPLDQLRSHFARAIHGLSPDLYDADVPVVPTSNPAFGDYQCNAAMALAKPLKQKPRDVAATLVAAIGDLGGMAEKVEIAGPGFINVTLANAWIEKQLAAAAEDGRLGIATVEAPQTIVVDYSGPNVAKEMHVGHLRSTIIGDAVSRVLEFQGQTIIRQNHLGDWGTQFGRVILGLWYAAAASADGKPSLLDHWQQGLATLPKKVEKESETERQAKLVAERAYLTPIVAQHQQWLTRDDNGDAFFSKFLDEHFPDLSQLERLYQFASALTDLDAAVDVEVEHRTHGRVALSGVPRLTARFVQEQAKSPNEVEGKAWERSIKSTMAACQALYERLGVLLRPSDERGESFYNPRLRGIVNELKHQGLAADSEGAVGVFIDGEKKPPLIIEKTGGGFLYGTTDLAAARFRVEELHADRVIYFTDARQAQHFSQVFRTAEKAGWSKGASLEHAPFGNVLGRDGKPFKTRSGDTVKLKDLLDEAVARALAVVNEKSAELPEEQKQRIAEAVGIGAVKYADLSKDRSSDYVFDFDTMLAMDGNTAPYLQYAHARVRSIFRNAGGDAKVGPIAIGTAEERALATHLPRLGEVIDDVARDLKPHLLCQYLYDLATKFSSFYVACPVLKSEEPTRSSRLALCDLTARTLALGLDLLGIEHPDQM